jgi:hypothetical protein
LVPSRGRDVKEASKGAARFRCGMEVCCGNRGLQSSELGVSGLGREWGGGLVRSILRVQMRLCVLLWQRSMFLQFLF